MKTLFAALALLLVAGCSGDGRDEDAFFDAAFKNASTEDLANYNSDQILKTGELACSMMRDGEDYPDVRNSAVTGVPWYIVWLPADAYLCPQN